MTVEAVFLAGLLARFAWLLVTARRSPVPAPAATSTVFRFATPDASTAARQRPASRQTLCLGLQPEQPRRDASGPRTPRLTAARPAWRPHAPGSARREATAAPENLKLWRAYRLPFSALKMGSLRPLLPLRRKQLPFLMTCQTSSGDACDIAAGGAFAKGRVVRRSTGSRAPCTRSALGTQRSCCGVGLDMGRSSGATRACNSAHSRCAHRLRVAAAYGRLLRVQTRCPALGDAGMTLSRSAVSFLCSSVARSFACSLVRRPVLQLMLAAAVRHAAAGAALLVVAWVQLASSAAAQRAAAQRRRSRTGCKCFIAFRRHALSHRHACKDITLVQHVGAHKALPTSVHSASIGGSSASRAAMRGP